MSILANDAIGDSTCNATEIDLDFLRKVIPADGIMQITTIKGHQVKNIPCDDFEKMGDTLQSVNANSVDVYHACASFKSDSNRQACNVKSLKAFFLDLDCGEGKAAENQGYSTKTDALIALKAFCQSVGLPRPMLVDSGGGIHAYWPFQTAVPAADWKYGAEGLKSLCKSHGLFADRQVTADAARILRPVGSHNRKYGRPREVTLLKDADCLDFASIKAIIDAAANRFEAVDGSTNERTAQQATANKISASLAEKVNPNRYSISQVEEALKHIDPGCPRCEWVPVGMAVADAFGEPGRNLFLGWSRGDLWEPA